jgi:bifunctional ADP-heptose synthase (sugar kinase/adenylyltransferase)
MQLVSSLSFVDYVTSFEEVDPRQLIEAIRPHVHVNGAEYGTHCIEAETVSNIHAKLHLVPKIEGLSTSQLIQTIKNVCAS